MSESKKCPNCIGWMQQLESERQLREQMKFDVDQLRAELEEANKKSERFADFAKQVISDIDAIEKEILPEGQEFAEWSSVANTRQWAKELIT